jgi:hypothetical protein
MGVRPVDETAEAKNRQQDRLGQLKESYQPTPDERRLLDGHLRARMAAQAAGMVSVQLGVSLTDALVAMRARAYAEGRTISQVAADVVARRLSFALPEFSLPGFGAPSAEEPAASSGDPPAPENQRAEDEHREGDE